MSEQPRPETEPQKAAYTVTNIEGCFSIWKRPDGTEIKTREKLLEELNALLARGEKAEAAAAIREVVLAQMKSALHATYAETHHPDIGAAERKPMMPHERIEWLGKDRDNWESRAKKAEAERDELKRKLSDSEADRRELQSQNGRMRFELKSYGATSVPPVDWNRVRVDAAIAAMQGMLADTAYDPGREMAATAVAYADDLVFELRDREQE